MEFIKQYQTMIESTTAIDLGFQTTKDRTGELLNDFFKDIVECVLEEKGKYFLVQWAISEITEDESKQLKEKLNEKETTKANEEA